MHTTTIPYAVIPYNSIPNAVELSKMSNYSIVAISVILLLSGALTAVHADNAPSQPQAAGAKQLRHVVLFKFKEGTTNGQIDEVIAAFRALKGKIDVIQDFEYGTDVSVENKTQGFTHCFFVTFRDEKGRDAYLPHPAHKAFGELVRPRLDKVLVVDYWVRN
jgi:hypothetical protein